MGFCLGKGSTLFFVLFEFFNVAMNSFTLLLGPENMFVAGSLILVAFFRVFFVCDVRVLENPGVMQKLPSLAQLLLLQVFLHFPLVPAGTADKAPFRVTGASHSEASGLAAPRAPRKDSAASPVRGNPDQDGRARCGQEKGLIGPKPCCDRVVFEKRHAKKHIVNN